MGPHEIYDLGYALTIWRKKQGGVSSIVLDTGGPPHGRCPSEQLPHSAVRDPTH